MTSQAGTQTITINILPDNSDIKALYEVKAIG